MGFVSWTLSSLPSGTEFLSVAFVSIYRVFTVHLYTLMEKYNTKLTSTAGKRNLKILLLGISEFLRMHFRVERSSLVGPILVFVTPVRSISDLDLYFTGLPLRHPVPGPRYRRHR